MAKFAYNNDKNASTGYTTFELNYGYHPWMLYKEEVDLRSNSKPADKLSAELRELIIVCQIKLYYTQEVPKRAHDKGVKPRNYTSDEKI